MNPADEPDVLAINLIGQPGVALLDNSELCRLRSMGTLHLVAERNPREIAGYLLAFDDSANYDGEEFLRFRKQMPGRYIYVDQIAVAEASRRTGLGALLYETLESVAIQRKIPVICCEVNVLPPNPESMAFHENLGFRYKARMTTSDGRLVVLLVKDLASKAGPETKQPNKARGAGA